VYSDILFCIASDKVKYIFTSYDYFSPATKIWVHVFWHYVPEAMLNSNVLYSSNVSYFFQAVFSFSYFLIIQTLQSSKVTPVNHSLSHFHTSLLSFLSWLWVWKNVEWIIYLNFKHGQTNLKIVLFWGYTT
jgi:hypothetical protein